jgi:hypothetical protein
MDEPPRPSRAPWALAAAAVAIVAIAVGGGLYVFRSVRNLPGDVVEGGRKALNDLRDVAAAFRTGTVTTTFRSYATNVTGTTRLQFAELRQEELFERRDTEAVLWGTLALPDVVVEARAPVAYTYFLDLDKEWRFRLEGRDVLVVVPPMEWNRPAADVSALRFAVREGSVIRDEQVALDRLRAQLTPLLERRARQHVPLVRETGRRKVEAFVETWLVQRFDDGAEHRARVVFADEPAAKTPRPPALVPGPASPAPTAGGGGQSDRSGRVVRAGARTGSRSPRRAGRRWPRRGCTLPPSRRPPSACAASGPRGTS